MYALSLDFNIGIVAKRGLSMSLPSSASELIHRHATILIITSPWRQDARDKGDEIDADIHMLESRILIFVPTSP